MAVTHKKKASKQVVSEGIVYINASFNNTIVTVTNLSGDKLCSKSAGQCDFKGARQSTPFAGQVTAEKAVTEAIDSFNMRRASIHVKGPGGGRESAIRAVSSAGLDIVRITDKTGVPFNGCRPRKKRRV